MDALSRFPRRDNKKEANLQAENTQIIHCLQSSLTNALISDLSSTASGLLPQHQVLICEIYALLQLRHLWNNLQIELSNQQPYKASISSIKPKLQELQEANRKVQELRQ